MQDKSLSNNHINLITEGGRVVPLIQHKNSVNGEKITIQDLVPSVDPTKMKNQKLLLIEQEEQYLDKRRRIRRENLQLLD